MYSKKMNVSKVCNIIGENTLLSLNPFRDAGIGPADFPISVVDVLRGLSIGLNY